jgi:hypothetical protein
MTACWQAGPAGKSDGRQAPAHPPALPGLAATKQFTYLLSSLRRGDKDWRYETDNDGWRNPVIPTEEKGNRCDAGVGRQLDRMNLVIQPFLSEIHVSIQPACGSNNRAGNQTGISLSLIQEGIPARVELEVRSLLQLGALRLCLLRTCFSPVT